MAEHQLTCRGCGEQFTYHRRKAYCALECRPSMAPISGKRLAEAACRQEYSCFWCEKKFNPKKPAYTKFCGRECAFAFKAAKASVVKPVVVKVRRKGKPKPNGECRRCGRPYYRERAYQRHCTAECASLAAADAKEREKRSPARRASKKRRKALERGASLGDMVDPSRVFDRDGWRCRDCGRRTPKTRRGTTHPRAPELDHIEPLSLGGEHSYRNTQCLCRECNGKKSDKAGGQLLLFG